MNKNDFETGLAAFVAAVSAAVEPTPSIVLYGSAARGDWDPNRSDVNLLVVLQHIDPAKLRKLSPAVTAWHEQGGTPPLIMSREEWNASVDVFPIEVTDMQLARRVLAGDDPVAPLQVDPADLRRAVEEALRGKLVHLRQAFVRFHDSGPTLGGFASTSISELLVLLRSLAVVRGRDPGTTVDSLVAALSNELGDTASAVAELAARRRDMEWSCSPELFAEYLKALQCAVAVVDTHTSGEN